MGLFDQIMNKLGEIAGAVTDAASNAAAEKVEPEQPTAFGWRNAWLAIRADSAEAVIQKLGVKNAKVSGWEKGIAKAEEDGLVFVTQPIKGYVLVVGTTVLADHMERLDGLSRSFQELLLFATHDIVDLQCWARYENGTCVRRYSFLGERGEVLYNDGPLTEAERAAGMENLLMNSEDDWDTAYIPSEDDVLMMAKLWSVDTTFEDDTYAPTTGFVGEWK